MYVCFQGGGGGGINFLQLQRRELTVSTHLQDHSIIDFWRLIIVNTNIACTYLPLELLEAPPFPLLIYLFHAANATSENTIIK